MTDNDRELLELAARAAGFKNYIDDVDRYGTAALWVRDDEVFVGQWAPLTDDGDALRLAMKLGASIHVRRVDEYSRIYSEVFICDLYGSEIYAVGRQEHDADPASATRRAIVRAAAEIGRRM